jgi:hypothetical protein
MTSHTFMLGFLEIIRNGIVADADYIIILGGGSPARIVSFLLLLLLNSHYSRLGSFPTAKYLDYAYSLDLPPARGRFAE